MVAGSQTVTRQLPASSNLSFQSCPGLGDPGLRRRRLRGQLGRRQRPRRGRPGRARTARPIRGGLVRRRCADGGPGHAGIGHCCADDPGCADDCRLTGHADDVRPIAQCGSAATRPVPCAGAGGGASGV